VVLLLGTEHLREPCAHGRSLLGPSAPWRRRKPWLFSAPMVLGEDLVFSAASTEGKPRASQGLVQLDQDMPHWDSVSRFHSMYALLLKPYGLCQLSSYTGTT
jgi:hypothetical protein